MQGDGSDDDDDASAGESKLSVLAVGGAADSAPASPAPFSPLGGGGGYAASVPAALSAHSSPQLVERKQLHIEVASGPRSLASAGGASGLLSPAGGGAGGLLSPSMNGNSSAHGSSSGSGVGGGGTGHSLGLGSNEPRPLSLADIISVPSYEAVFKQFMQKSFCEESYLFLEAARAYRFSSEPPFSLLRVLPGSGSLGLCILRGVRCVCSLRAGRASGLRSRGNASCDLACPLTSTDLEAH